ncbi:MAG: hypothetical protein AVDCRST_MAG59-2886, partial [uncultured Thermomicrobiales bacterium]
AGQTLTVDPPPPGAPSAPDVPPRRHRRDPAAGTIGLVLDQLNPTAPASLSAAFPPTGRRSTTSPGTPRGSTSPGSSRRCL